MDDVVNALLDSITPGNLTNDTLLALSLLLPPRTIIAALDLVETRAVTRWKNAWDRITHHTVSGSSQTYLINLALPNYDNARSDNVPLRVHDFPNLLHPLAADGAEQRVNRYQPLATFCTCPAFTYTILLCPHGPRSTPLMCKHILAVHIAERMEQISEHIASEDADFEQLAGYL